MRCGAGGGTTICSLTCCAPAWHLSGQRRYQGCTTRRPPGMRSRGPPTMRCGMPSPPAKPAGRPGWSSGMWRRCCGAARAPRLTAGFPRCPRRRSAPGRGCAWPRPLPPSSPAAWSRSSRWWRARSVLANVPAAIAFLRADLARWRGDPARAADLDAQALAHLGEEDWLLRSQVAWNLAGVDWLRGRLAQAEHALAVLVAERRAAGEGYLAMRVCYELGQVQCAQGCLGAALRTYQQGLQAAGGAGQQPPFAGMAHVGMAEVLYERDELPAAHEHAAQGVTLCRRLAYTQPLATGRALLARIRWAHGDTAGALDAIGQAERVGLSPQVAALHNPVPAWRAQLLLASGEVAGAAHWASRRGLRTGDEPVYPREREYLALARVLLAKHAPGEALGLLDRLHAKTAAQRRTGSVIMPSITQPPAADSTPRSTFG